MGVVGKSKSQLFGTKRNTVYVFYKHGFVFLQAKIGTLDEGDWEWLENSEEFSFDWFTESSLEVYKIFLVDHEKQLLGVMSLVDHPEEFRIHLNLLEVSRSNQGQHKGIDHIAGCLIAFAAENVFKRGCWGFVSLEPKTLLIKHYMQKYGFSQYGRYLGIEGNSSHQLIVTYLGNE